MLFEEKKSENANEITKEFKNESEKCDDAWSRNKGWVERQQFMYEKECKRNRI
jgi:hypothetical protein